MKSEILSVIKYFSFFNYFPTEDEIYLFLKTKTSRVKFKQILNEMAIKNTVGEYGIKVKSSLMKIKKIDRYVRLLSYFPQIKLIGLSGSVAMNNAKEEDDIDLFIITAKNRLFTARFIAILIAQLLNLKRFRVTRFALHATRTNRDKVCLNLFFDESNLKVPKNKRTEYVAHEILQMKPLVNKNNTHMMFIDFELFIKKLQLYFINKHKTNEIVTDTQLWFHPVDFNKKIKNGV